GADLALALELGKGLVDTGVAQDGHVVAVGVHQHQIDMLGLQAAQAALHGKAGVLRREIEARLAVLELLAHLADDHPLLALAAQQRTQALLAAPVGRRGIDQVDRSEERRVGKESSTRWAYYLIYQRKL